MWDFIKPISLIRYLIVWRVNATLVQLPRYLPFSLSYVLGTLIAERLPLAQKREWRPCLEALAEITLSEGLPSKMPADVAWPLTSVIFAYPNKRAFGQGEVILWELKLIGDSADHCQFLELILPAMEQAATMTDAPWYYRNGVWGHFDVEAIYASRGARWEPFVSAGKLNLDYHPTPQQWADGLTFAFNSEHSFRRLTWITPFELAATEQGVGLTARHSRNAVPLWSDLVGALLDRMTLFLPGKRNTSVDWWLALPPAEQTRLRDALEQAETATLQRHTLEAPPRGLPGRWIGTQVFSTIPASLLPYLELAAILHLGKNTHLGCGTFRLDF